MTWNERPSPYGRWSTPPHKPYSDYPPKPRVVEPTLDQREVVIERKLITLLLKENPRGRFLRIIEDSGGQRQASSIIIPMSGLKEFQQMLADMVAADGQIPPKSGTAPADAGK